MTATMMPLLWKPCVGTLEFLTMANQQELERLVEQLVGAMKKSVKVGCTDHLDCCDDAGEFWYNAISDAEDLLGYRIPSQ